MNDQMDNMSDMLTLISVKKRKKALMLRAGGIGDTVILTTIAQQLDKKGFDVDYFVGSPSGKVFELFEDIPYIKNCKEIKRVNGIDCVEDGNKNLVSVEILKTGYDEVFDFKNSVEHNRSGFNGDEGWRGTINSNYMNWIDLSMAWINVDWTKVHNQQKVPQIGFKAKQAYDLWLETTGVPKKEGRGYKVIGIQMAASSLVRTFYRASDIPDMLHKKYPDDVILVFDRNMWFALTKFGRRQIEFDEDLNPLIQSVVLLKEMDLFICADSGFSHLAAACEVPCLSIYTTVPSWTRAKYYPHQVSINASVECSPCFTLDGFCPLNKKKAYDSLTERERYIIEAASRNENIYEVAKKFKTVPKAIMDEHQSAQTKLQALSAEMPACVASITAEQVVERVEEILC